MKNEKVYSHGYMIGLVLNGQIKWFKNHPKMMSMIVQEISYEFKVTKKKGNFI